LEQHDKHPLFCPVFILDRRLQQGTSHPKWKQQAKKKVHVEHLHHYSRYAPLIWDPKTKLVSPQFHMVFYDNFETVQPPNTAIKMDDTMDRVFRTSIQKYDDPFWQ
jgi:hypothetical protein